MSEPLLRLSPGLDGGLVLELRDPEGVEIEEEISVEVLEAFRTASARLDSVLCAARGEEREEELRSEERLAVEHADLVLAGHARIRERLAWHARAADAEGRSMVLLLEIHDLALQAFPWELVSGAAKGSSPLSGASVVRLIPVRDWVWPRTGNWLEIVCTGPSSLGGDFTDPGGLGEELADLEMVQVIQAEMPSVPTPPRAGSPYRVHHCRAMGPPYAPEPDAKDEIALTIVEPVVVGEARNRLDPADAWSIGRCGPTVCVSRPMLGGIRVLAWDSFYRAIAGGLSLVEAVETLRDGLRRLCHGYQEMRWWGLVFMVPEEGFRAAPAPLSEGLRFPGAPQGQLEGEAILSRARLMGRRVGYVGLEHLARAMVENSSEISLLHAARPSLVLALERVEELDGSPGEPRVTPRLQTLLSSLPVGYGVADLLSSLVKTPWLSRSFDPFLVERLRVHRDEVEESIELSIDDKGQARRRRLLLEGGPEDGRVISLRRAGMVIGRWDPRDPENREGKLFIDSTCVDRTVSRHALVWHGGDWIESKSELRLEREGFAPVSVSGRVQLSPGDRIWLGTATCVQLLD